MRLRRAACTDFTARPRSSTTAKLAALPNLRDVVFVGNPMYEGITKEDARIEVLKQLPNLAKVDGSMITPSERDKAAGIEE